MSTESSTGHRAREGAEMARGALVNAAALAAANLRGLFTFLIARLLGSAALGTFAIAWAITDLLSKPGTLGLEQAGLALVAKREAEGDRAGSRRLFGRALAWGVGCSALVAVGGIWVLQVWGERLGQPAPVVAVTSIVLLSLPGIALYRIANGVSRGLKVMKHDVVSRGVAETLGTLLAFLIGLSLGLRERAPAVAVVLGTAAGGVVAFILAARRLWREPAEATASGPVSGPMLRFATPIATYSLLSMLSWRLDVILLGAFIDRAPGLTLATFGVYCAAVEAAGGLRKVRQAFDPIFMPIVAAHSLRRDAAALRDAAGQVTRWVMAILLPTVGVFALAASLIMSIFGPSFTDGALWLALLAVAHGTAALVNLGETVIAVEKPRLNVINMTVVVAVQLAASVVLIVRFGATGAALAAIGSYLLLGVLRSWQIRRAFGWTWPWAALWRPVSAFALAAGPALGARLLLDGWVAELGSSLILLGAYVLAWRILGLDEDDRAAFAAMRRRRAAA